MTSLAGSITYPTKNTYQQRVPAWVHFSPQPFSTLPFTRKRAAVTGSGGSYILPLQRYSAPNQIGYEDTKPGAVEMGLQGVRDIFAGGGLGKLGDIVSNIPLFGGVVSLNDVINVGAGVGGAALQDVSYSDMMFKNAQKRTHGFGFDLFAKNFEDAVTIDKIVNGFQVRSYGTLSARTFSKVTPPPMWYINIVPAKGNSKSRVLDNDIQACVLTNFNVTKLDSSTTPTLTKDNYYLAMSIQLSFLEIEPAYRSSQSAEKLSSRAGAGDGSIL